MRIGVDLGGTKIEAAALDDGGEILLRRREPTPRDSYQATVEAVATLVRQIEADYDTRATVGVGIPGAISPATGLVKNANSTWLIGKPFDRDLSAALDRTVRVANDANCFALSEAVDGAAAGARVVFGVILGTGVGGGIVIDGRPLTGAHAIAGEWGHNPMPGLLLEEWPDRPCYCGRTSCIEAFLSGPAITLDHQRRTSEELPADEIAQRAAAGDPAARETIELHAARLARALATVINVLDPDAIVLGGGVSNIAALYELVPPALAEHVFSDVVTTPIVQAVHGDSSGVRGAAWLWRPDEHEQGLPRP
ncbi:MAG: ROK family protein [Chloroflexi bacterium]|nr:ROK family protein [Chloroflexota bacterium]MDA1146669.1 ROK family protein [Chloroflexota bacterium]MQC82788.1 ROK family protein [Chloroflexota bacterium]